MTDLTLVSFQPLSRVAACARRLATAIDALDWDAPTCAEQPRVRQAAPHGPGRSVRRRS